MQGGPLSDQQTDDMVAFLGTLKPPPPANEGTHDAVLSSRIRRGQELFVSQGCAECHAGPTLTSVDVYDVGLVDEAGRGQFNPPSLRGVEHRRRFFHDGRASRLEDIFTKHMHQTEGTLSDESLSDLAAFLRSQ